MASWNALPDGPAPAGFGVTVVTRPSGHWSAARSRSHLSENPATSWVRAAVATWTCQSPVNPDRSRCGQSVGMSQALSRRLHTAASCRALSRSSSQPNHPVSARSVCTTTAVTSVAPSGPGCPSTCTYRKPWVVCRGSNTSPGRPAETTSSTWPAGRSRPVAKSNARRWSVVTRPSTSTCSPCVRVSVVPAGPRSVSRTQPLTFWPKSTTTPPPATRVRAVGVSSSIRRTGGAIESTSRSRSA